MRLFHINQAIIPVMILWRTNPIGSTYLPTYLPIYLSVEKGDDSIYRKKERTYFKELADAIVGSDKSKICRAGQQAGEKRIL